MKDVWLKLSEGYLRVQKEGDFQEIKIPEIPEEIARRLESCKMNEDGMECKIGKDLNILYQERIPIEGDIWGYFGGSYVSL